METTQRYGKIAQAVNLGLITNIFLAAIKTSIGIIGHSPALLADGINSTSDVAYYIVVSIFMRMSRKPADREHPFGHSQLETIAALTVGSFVITTAIAIFWDAINNVFDYFSGEATPITAHSFTFWVALFTVLLKIFLFYLTSKLGKQTSNPAVQALAFDHRNDIFSASAALIGILMSQVGYPWVDPLAGAIVALIILRTGINILTEAASELMDTVPGVDLEKTVADTLSTIPGIKKVESIRAHRFGPYLVMNLTIGIDGSLSVAEGDRIATSAERKLIHSIDFLRVVHIHYHPASRN
jgi:cation diffusion facilitator family transporter